jgi:hypothetical protein
MDFRAMRLMTLDLGTSRASAMKIPAGISGLSNSRLDWCKTHAKALTMWSQK